MKIWGSLLLIWWIYSFYAVYQDYLNGRLSKEEFIIYEVVNLLCLSYIILSIYLDYKLPAGMAALAYILMSWFSGFSMWNDLFLQNTSWKLRLFYFTIDVLTALYIFFTLYFNTISKAAEITTKNIMTLIQSSLFQPVITIFARFT